MEEKNQLALNKKQENGIVSRIKNTTTDLRLKDYDDTKEIQNLLIRLFAVTGMKPDNIPSPKSVQGMYLMNFIKENYSFYTIDEILLAFELSVKRELLPFMGKNDSANHFQNFSIDYFCSIMNGYRNYKSKTMSIELNKKKEVTAKYYKQGTVLEFFEKMLFSRYDKFIKDEKYCWEKQLECFLFTRLESIGVIEMTNKEKSDIKSDVVVSMELKSIKNKEMKNTKIKNECRSRCFNIWIKEQQFGDVDIREIIIPKIKESENE